MRPGVISEVTILIVGLEFTGATFINSDPYVPADLLVCLRFIPATRIANQLRDFRENGMSPNPESLRTRSCELRGNWKSRGHRNHEPVQKGGGTHGDDATQELTPRGILRSIAKTIAGGKFGC
jgi:hypothetical protein